MEGNGASVWKSALKRGSRGFSLVEILIVMAIVGVLVAIAVPAALQQRHRSTDAATKADILQVQAGIKEALNVWRDSPPGDVAISFTSPQWSIAYGSATIASGTASPNDTITGTLWADGSYCIQANNPNGSNNWILRSDTAQIASGSCPLTAIGGTGSLPSATTVSLPGAVSGLTVVNTSGVDNSLNISWTAVSSATSYSVTAIGPNNNTTVNVIAPSVAVTMPNLDGGATTVTVRAINSNGGGVSSSSTITVNGGIISNSGLTSLFTAASGATTLERVQVGTTGIGLGGSTLTSDASTIKFGTNALLATAAWIAGRSDGGINFYTQSAGGSIINNLSLTSTGNTFNTDLQITSGTASTNSTTGALVVTGGSGVSGALNVGGNVLVTGTCTGCGGGAATLTDDNSTNSTYYLTLATATSGLMTTAKTSSTKLTFNPFSGALTAVGFGSPVAGKATITPGGDTGGTLISTNGDTNKGLIVQANSATQSANIFEIQSSTGSLLASVDPRGNFFASSLEFKSRVQAASTSALTVTYANGTSGVGATLTNAGGQSAFTIDGYTAALKDRILIKDQASPVQNGIYTVTTLGSGSTNWALTRALDANKPLTLATDMVAIDQGTSNSGAFWRTTFRSIDVIGTNNIIWTQVIGAAPAILDDNSNNLAEYLAITTSTSGSMTAVKTSSTELNFNPSTGVLTTVADAQIHGITVGTGANSSTTNTAFGFSALINNTTTNNTGIGYGALNTNSTGTSNTAVGTSALQVSTGSGSSAFGYAALGAYANAGATYNTAFGIQSLYYANTSIGNVGIGIATLGGANTYSGNYSVGAGSFAGYQLYAGINNYNTLLGYQAGYYDYATASNNLDLGNATGNSTLDTSNNTVRVGNVGSAGAFSNLSLLSGTLGTTVAGSLLSLNGLTVNGGGLTVSTGPNVQVGTTYTVVAADYSIIETTSNLTVTLPTCNTTAGNSGRILVFRNGVSANSIIASGAVVVPLGATAGGTAIIPATAGKFAQIQCQGSSGLWYVNTSN